MTMSNDSVKVYRIMKSELKKKKAMAAVLDKDKNRQNLYACMHIIIIIQGKN